MKHRNLHPGGRLRRVLPCVPAVMLAMLAAMAMANALEPHGVQRVHAAEAPEPAKDNAAAPADLTSGGRPARVYKLEPSASENKWREVQQTLDRHAKINLTVWYDFGSLNLKGTPENDLYRIDITIERELAENEKTSMMTCIIHGQHFSILDLVRDGDKVRNSPPEQLPEPLNALCRDRPLGMESDPPP